MESNRSVEAAAVSHSDRGAALVEYALLAALIAVVCIAAVTFLGDDTNDSFDSNASSLFSD